MITNPTVRHGVVAVAVVAGTLLVLKVLGVVAAVVMVVAKLGLLVGLVAGGVYFYRNVLSK